MPVALSVEVSCDKFGQGWPPEPFVVSAVRGWKKMGKQPSTPPNDSHTDVAVVALKLK